MASAASAFSAEAAAYDGGFGRNPVGLLFRHVFQERARALFAPGAHVLDLGCGTGEDALALAAAGIRVTGIDPAPEMVARARAKLEAAGLPEGSCHFAGLAAEDVAELGDGFDGAYSDFGALNCADLATVGRGLERALRPGAPVLLSLLGPRPLPFTLRRVLTGVGEPRRSRSPQVGGVPVAVAYPGAAEVRRALGGAFAWRPTLGLGVLAPPPDAADWVAGHPQTFGALAAVESVVRGWPLLRELGDHMVLEGWRT